MKSESHYSTHDAPPNGSTISPLRPNDAKVVGGEGGGGALGETVGTVAAMEQRVLGEIREIASQMREIERRLQAAAEARETALTARCARWVGVGAPLVFAAGVLLGIGVAGRRW